MAVRLGSEGVLSGSVPPGFNGGDAGDLPGMLGTSTLPAARVAASAEPQYRMRRRKSRLIMENLLLL